MTPSHTFLLWLFEAGNLQYSDIEPVKVANAIDAADIFKKGQVDAAVVWSPDDADCVAKVAGFKSTSKHTNPHHISLPMYLLQKRNLLKKTRKS